jgi:1-deoxy-D-xylulose-5-phosphate reductoisomerase
MIHPQSVVHSMVEFVDGTVLAQLGVTDMRLPIQYALSHPERWEAAIPGLDFTRAFGLDFDLPDHGASRVSASRTAPWRAAARCRPC